MLKSSEGFSGILRTRKKQKTKWFTEKTRRGFKPFSLLEPFRNLTNSGMETESAHFRHNSISEPRRRGATQA
jgi:hypothetical protein